MLIHLDGSAAADAVSSSATAGRSRACIENLLLAHFQGDHVISLEPSDAALLRAVSPPWSDRARRALDHADENYAQIAGLREDVPWSLELGIGPGFDGKLHSAGDGKNILRALLHDFEKSRAALPSALLGENPTDAELFHQLGLMRQSERRWDQLGMVHDRHGAGGSTFALTYRSFADQGRILLAAADTDRRHPKDSGGDTYKNLRAEAQGRPDYQRARSIPARTAEGLIPMDVYREVFESKHGDQRIHRVGRIEQFLRSAPSDILQFAHLKDGISLYQVQHPTTRRRGAIGAGSLKMPSATSALSRPQSSVPSRKIACVTSSTASAQMPSPMWSRG